MRAFIIGNGPSLREHLKKGHFNLLKNEVTFGVNRINLIFEETDWRPSHYVLFDRSNSTVYCNDISAVLKSGANGLIRADIPTDSEAIYWYKTYGDRFNPVPQCTHQDADNNPTKTWHLDDDPAFCKQGGSVSAAIQWAVVLGFNPLYIIGCDLGFKPHCTTNHFTPDYVHPDALSAKTADRAQRTGLLFHSIARKECDKRGIEIYNAGIGGALNKYERADFGSLFE